MQKENKKNVIWIIVGIVVLVAVFYGGMVYGKGQAAASRAAYAGARTRGAGFTGGSAGAAGGFTTGTILSKDATSITVGLMAGGSKIVFLDSTTKISKSASGTMADLVVGTQVSVMGATNTDGSISADTLQIRPAMTTKPATTVVQ